MFDDFVLNNGKKIPSVGFGTWRIPSGDETYNAVINAIDVGYYHIDTAKVYRNEESVGLAVRESGVGRSELFVTSKLWNTDRGYDSTLRAFEESLNKLGLEYLDLYLIHWPAAKHQFDNWEEINLDTWRAMTRLYKEGLIKSIGVSNFLPHHLKALLETEVPPMVNQIEIHPGYAQLDAVKFCQENHIVVEAWSPLGAGKMLSNETLIALANKYDKSVAQICLRYCVEHNILPLTRTTKKDRMVENSKIFDFELDVQDVEIIDKMERGDWSGNHPDTLDC